MGCQHHRQRLALWHHNTGPEKCLNPSQGQCEFHISIIAASAHRAAAPAQTVPVFGQGNARHNTAGSVMGWPTLTEEPDSRGMGTSSSRCPWHTISLRAFDNMRFSGRASSCAFRLWVGELGMSEPSKLTQVPKAQLNHQIPGLLQQARR